MLNLNQDIRGSFNKLREKVFQNFFFKDVKPKIFDINQFQIIQSCQNISFKDNRKW